MSFLIDHAATVAVALVVSMLGWLYGGTRGGLLTPVVPWVFVFLLEVIFFFPQRRSGETTYDARERVWRALKRDPLVWTALALFILLLLPFMNVGLCPSCDARAIAQGADPAPPVPFLPFCVNALDHLNVVWWFALALPVMVAVKHSLASRGKRLLLQLVLWNGVALAVLGFVQSATSALGPYWIPMHPGIKTVLPGSFFSTFGYPNMAGDYFVTLFGIGVALWRDRLDVIHAAHLSMTVGEARADARGTFWRRHYFLIPALICFYAALNTLSRAAILLVTSGAVIYFLHAFVTFLSRKRKVDRVKTGALSLLVLGTIVFCAAFFAPPEIQREVNTLGTTEVLDRVTGRGQYHARIATEIWEDHPFFGCGGWGYIHFCIPKMTPEDRRNQQMVGGINVHNDYLQLLAEHGAVGFGLMLTLVFMMLKPIFIDWHRLARACRFVSGKNRPPRPTQIFALPAPVFCLLVTTVSTLIHAFGDCPLRSPAVLTLFFAVLAALPGFMPHLKED